jgi:hypothetical protein
MYQKKPYKLFTVQIEVLNLRTLDCAIGNQLYKNYSRLPEGKQTTQVYRRNVSLLAS